MWIKSIIVIIITRWRKIIVLGWIYIIIEIERIKILIIREDFINWLKRIGVIDKNKIGLKIIIIWVLIWVSVIVIIAVHDIGIDGIILKITWNSIFSFILEMFFHRIKSTWITLFLFRIRIGWSRRILILLLLKLLILLLY
jgi:hypothetical protein